MKCDRYHDLVMRHFDHVLDAGEEERLRLHLEACPHCRALFDDLRGILGTLETAPQGEADPGLERLVMDRLDTMPASAPGAADGIREGLYGSMGVAALLLVCVAPFEFPATGYLDLITGGIRGLSSIMEMAWIAQTVYDLASGFFAHAMALLIQTVYGIFILTGLTAAVMVLKSQLRPGRAVKQGRLNNV